jgi:hypothetical protein
LLTGLEKVLPARPGHLRPCPAGAEGGVAGAAAASEQARWRLHEARKARRRAAAPARLLAAVAGPLNELAALEGTTGRPCAWTAPPSRT